MKVEASASGSYMAVNGATPYRSAGMNVELTMIGTRSGSFLHSIAPTNRVTPAR